MFKNKVFKNASWIIGCQLCQSILSFVVMMLTARYLGPSNYGMIYYAASLVAFAAPIVQLGLGNIQVQELVAFPEEEGKIVGTTLLSTFLMAFFGCIGVISFSMIADAGEFETILVCAIYSMSMFFYGANLIQYWFQSKLLSKYASLVSLLAFSLTSAYKIFLLISSKSIRWFAFSESISGIFILLSLLMIYKKLGGQKLSFSKSVLQRMFSKSKYFIIANIMVVVFTQTDRVMLKLMLDSSATGFYSAAVSCACMLNFVFSAIIDSARPGIFENHKKSLTQFNESISFLYSVIIYLSLAFCVFITAFAKQIIYIIYGSQYWDAVLPLRIVVWFLPFSFIGFVRNIWLLAENKQKWLPVIDLSGAISNVGLNYVLIPAYGVAGAAIATLFTQFISNIVISSVIKDVRPNSKLLAEGLDLTKCLRALKLLRT